MTELFMLVLIPTTPGFDGWLATTGRYQTEQECAIVGERLLSDRFNDAPVPISSFACIKIYELKKATR